MFDIYFVVFLFIFSLLCFVEFIVFNEEILLALCFFSFIFFSFNTLSGSIHESFESRAAKFEADLLVSFNVNKQTLTQKFNNFFLSRGFNTKFKILLSSILIFLSHVKNYSIFKLSSNVLNSSFAKLNELLLLDTKLITAFQKGCITNLLYPLIFKTAKTDVLTITSINSNLTTSFSNKTSILKNLSI
jgi:hypothetical protein